MGGEQLNSKGGGGPREGYVYRGGVGDFRYFYNVNLDLFL